MHRIRRQILDLELPREQGAADLARRAGRLFQEKVLPELDKVFTKMAPEGQILRIRRLEVDLERLSETRFEEEFVNSCIRQIIRQMSEAAFEAAPEAAPAGVETLSAEENILAIFLHFAERGVLPWHAQGLPLAVVEKQLMELAAAQPGLIRRALAGKAQSWDIPVFQRLAWQFSLPFAEKMIETARELPAGTVAEVLKIWRGQSARELPPAQSAAVLKALARAGTATAFRLPPDPVRITAWLAEQGLSAPAHRKATPSAPEAAAGRPAGQQLPAASQQDDGRKHPEPAAVPSRAEARSRRMPTEEEGIPVENAGLALLAPYLPAFFDELNLSFQEAGPADTHRAVHLLHFLVTGRENPEEPQLLFPKLLCGLGWEAPVPQSLVLPDKEKTECRQLLEAVIRNWPALKNTSPDGLRGAFLQRPGLISWKEGQQAWMLRVERKAQDLLLDRIPWSYSVLKFKWMQQMILVEW